MSKFVEAAERAFAETGGWGYWWDSQVTQTEQFEIANEFFIDKVDDEFEEGPEVSANFLLLVGEAVGTE